MVQTRHKLQKQQHPTISHLAQTIKSIWRSQLMLFPYETPADLGYVEGTLEGEQLTIQNLCYQTFQFRKIHLELAKFGENLDILHCVMFPHPCFNLPIFGVDIVAVRGSITAAIVDLSPVSTGRTLPPAYSQELKKLSPVFFEAPRDLPAWGDIFSDYCLFVRPTTLQEEQAFLSRVTEYLSVHCQLACEAHIIEDRATRAAILRGQNYYCSQQQKNDKTRRILARAFNDNWAQRYLETMLFDCVPDSSSETTVRPYATERKVS